MRTHQIVHAFDVMSGFNGFHKRFLLKKIHPFLGVTVIHQKILQNKCVPAIALVQIQFFIKLHFMQLILRKIGFKKLLNASTSFSSRHVPFLCTSCTIAGTNWRAFQAVQDVDPLLQLPYKVPLPGFPYCG